MDSTTTKELFEAVRKISQHCALQGNDCGNCCLLLWCDSDERAQTPDYWPDPAEGTDYEVYDH